jgi:hypothetical protein
VTGALVLADDAPQLVIAEAVAAMEVADAVGTVVVARSRTGRVRGAQQAPWQGRIDSGPNWSKAKHRSG